MNRYFLINSFLKLKRLMSEYLDEVDDETKIQMQDEIEKVIEGIYNKGKND